MLADVSALRADTIAARVHTVAHGPSALHRRVGAVRCAGEHEAHQPRSPVLEVVHSALCENRALKVNGHRAGNVLRFNQHVLMRVYCSL